MSIVLQEKERACGNCINFAQYWMFNKENAVPKSSSFCRRINCGQCQHDVVKLRRPGGKACKDFKFK